LSIDTKKKTGNIKIMDEKKFARIVRETKGIVLSSVRNHLAGRFHHSIDDVVQETYLRAYRRLCRPGMNDDLTLNSWLYTIARNESYRMNERLKREETKFKNSAIKISDDMEKSNSKEAEIERTGLMDLKNIIKELPQKYRSVIELAALGYSEKEIADRLDIKKGTVKSRASRGREMMQKIYKKGAIYER
jgi:RNA polymerase sigma-70 factor (ECF subfamily)